MSYKQSLETILNNKIDQIYNPIIKNPNILQSQKDINFNQHITQVVSSIPKGASTQSLRDLCFNQEQQVITNIQSFQQKTVDLYDQMESINSDLNLKNLSIQELEKKCFEMDAKIKEQTAKRVIREQELQKQREIMQQEALKEESQQNIKIEINDNLERSKDQRLGLQNKAINKKKQNKKKITNKPKQEDQNLLSNKNGQIKEENIDSNNIYTEPMNFMNNNNKKNLKNSNILKQQSSNNNSQSSQNSILTPQKKCSKKMPFGNILLQQQTQQDENHHPNIQNHFLNNSISNKKYSNNSSQKGFTLFSNGKQVDDLTEEELQKDYFKKITDCFSNLKKNESKNSKNGLRPPLQSLHNKDTQNQLLASNNKNLINSLFNQNMPQFSNYKNYTANSSSGKKPTHFTTFSSQKRNTRFGTLSEEKYPSFLLSNDKGPNSECKNLFESYKKNLMNSYQKSYFQDAQPNNFLEDDILPQQQGVKQPPQQQDPQEISALQNQIYAAQQHYHHHHAHPHPTSTQINNYHCQICASCPPPPVLPGMEQVQQYNAQVCNSQFPVAHNYPPMSTTQILQHTNQIFQQQQQQQCLGGSYPQYQQGHYNQNRQKSNNKINIQQEFESMNDSVRLQLQYDLQ